MWIVINKFFITYEKSVKNIIKVIKKDKEREQKINRENYLRKKKIYRKNIIEIDIVICLKKKKTKRISKKLS